jgi:hypothetical protein
MEVGDIKFHENLSSGSRIVPYGRTEGDIDRHDGASGPFSQTGLIELIKYARLSDAKWNGSR